MQCSCCRIATRSGFTGSMTSAKLSVMQPDVAYCIAGKVNSADKLYLVIESVRLDTKHARCSIAPSPADGAGGSATS